jgi:hypothetical protein
MPSGLGHLGAKGNYADGEGNLMLRHTVVVVVNNVACSEGSKQPANWAANVRALGEFGRGARQSSPNRHPSPHLRSQTSRLPGDH